MDQNNFSSRLQTLINWTGMSKAEFARKTGIAQASVTYYLKGIYEPKDENIIRIATSCQVNPDWLRGHSDEMFKTKEQAISAMGDSLPKERREFIDEVRAMSDSEFERLKSILALVKQK